MWNLRNDDALAGDAFEKAERDSVLPIAAHHVVGIATSTNSKAKPEGRYGLCTDTECGERRRLSRTIRALYEELCLGQSVPRA